METTKNDTGGISLVTLEIVERDCKFIASTEDDYTEFHKTHSEATKSGGIFKQVQDLYDTFIYENDTHYSVNECGIQTLYEKRIVLSVYPVTLDKSDTCWTYCLKRVGYSINSISSLGNFSLIAIKPYYLQHRIFPIPKSAHISVDYEGIEDYFDIIPLCYPTTETVEPFYVDSNDKEHKLQSGDLLLFTAKETKQLIADTINADGTLEMSMHTIRRHVAVYEGNGMISDACLEHTSDKFDSITSMHIRYKRLSDLSQQPTHVLTLKKEY